MKNLIFRFRLPLLAIFLTPMIGLSSFARGDSSAMKVRRGPQLRVTAAPVSVFPKYPGRAPQIRPAPGRPMSVPAPAHMAVPVRQDFNGNRVTDDHLHRIDFANQRATSVMRKDPHVENHVNFHSAVFVGTLHPIYEKKNVLINEHFSHYHSFVVEHPLVWEAWHRHHFYGGFYYGFHPVPDIQLYFYNPLVHWFYIGTWDDDYYRTWYGQEYEAYPNLNHPFDYFGVFYPTDNLRQLLFGVSAMSVEKQAKFRSRISTFTQELTQQLANQLKSHVVLSKGDVVITHYEILGYDDAIVLEGFANFQTKTHNFKSMINLTDNGPVQTEVFVAPSSENPPSPDQLKSLDALNATIDTIRGVSPEPVVAPAPTPVVVVPSGEVSADPK